ncbi:TolC family protein [candidate division KSB1 bacterium]|nr:TolC family protein [candidate division KSB1 bacterium]
MVTKNLLLFLLLCISFCIGANHPAMALQKKHSFQDLEKLIVQNDHGIAAIRQKMQAMESRRSAAKALYLPKLSTQYRFFADGLNLTEEDFGRKHFLTLRLSQDLVKLTKVRSYKIDGINAELDILTSQLQSSKRFSFLKFRKAYIEILQNHSRIFYYKNLINTYEKIIKIKRRRYEEQEELLTEVLEIEKELIKVKGLHAYYQTQIEKQKDILAEFFQLTSSDIEWNATGLSHVQIR